MDILLYEIKKVIKSPILIALSVVFIVFNGIVIYDNSYIREDFKLANELIKKTGYEINDEMFGKMDLEYSQLMQELNIVTKEMFNKEFQSLSEFLDSEEYKKINYREVDFSDSEIDVINELLIVDMYKNLSLNLIHDYEEINIMEMAEEIVKIHGLSGEAANLVRKNYESLALRFEQLKDNGEYKNIFFPGIVYQMHRLLFGNIIGNCLIEIMILVVLMVSLLANYERDHKTLSLVSTTYRGRNLLKDKLIVTITSAILISMVILATSLFLYFIVFDYSEFLNVPISSAFNWEKDGPYICWYNLTLIRYLMLSLGVTFILSVMFACLAFIISCLLKNSYKTFFAFFIVFGAVFMLPTFINKSSPAMIWSNYNLFMMVLNPQAWFMEAGAFMTSKYYEITTILTNGIILVLLTILAINRFKKEAIV